MTRRYGIEWTVVALALLLGACSSSPEKDYRAIYASQEEIEQRPLEVPPEMGQPQIGEQMRIPSIGRDQASYSSQQGEARRPATAVATARDVRFVRQGNLQWLELAMPPGEVWGEVRAFFESLGFEITRADPAVGVMETNWQERREKIPTSWLSRMIDAISSTGYQDRYRIRLERMPNGGTRLFIAHRGMEEVVTGGGATEVVETAWTPREPDPGLEAELLQRFLISIGTTEQAAEQIVDTDEPADRTRLTRVQDEPVLEVKETFPRTWRRVGLALDRVGLLVEDRNRSEGLYYIKLTEEYKAREEKGFWSSLFGDENKGAAVDALLLQVRQQGDITEIRVRDRKGNPVDATLTERLLKDLEVHLR